MEQDRFTIAARLRELAMLLSLKGDNPFKVRAYERGAEALEHLTHDDLGAMVREDRLTDIEGVGSSLSSFIRELFVEGTSTRLDKVRSEIPRGLLELSKIDGIGHSKIRALHSGLGVSGLEELKAALESGRIRGLKGFGEKTEQKIRESVERYERIGDRVTLHDALAEVERLLHHARLDAKARRVELAGDLRRWHESTDMIEIVAASEDPRASAEHFAQHPGAMRVEAVADGETTIRTVEGTRAHLTAVPVDRFAWSWIERTGSEAHAKEVFGRAASLGLSASAPGFDSEEAIYRALGLAYVPPELREGEGELALAASSDAFGLVTEADVRGFIHCHTDYSDGVATISEMAEAADRAGAEYMTITDHSPGAFYARGVEIERLKKQWDEIDEVQSRVRVKLLRGTESDILADGSLDYPDEILEKLDVIIASIHSRHKMDGPAMTDRLIRAMRHPLFKIWGHPLGRLVLRRDPFQCDVEKVLDVIASERAAIEITGDPNRLEPEPKWIRAAHDRGIKFVISVDAHSTRALRYQKLGVHLARRGGATPGEVLNTLPFSTFKEAIRPTRG